MAMISDLGNPTTSTRRLIDKTRLYLQTEHNLSTAQSIHTQNLHCWQHKQGLTKAFTHTKDNVNKTEGVLTAQDSTRRVPRQRYPRTGWHGMMVYYGIG